MNGFEFKACRELMGISVNIAAETFNRDERTIRRWETGQLAVPFEVGILMNELFATFLDEVNDMIDEHVDEDAEDYPASATINPSNWPIARAAFLLLKLGDVETILDFEPYE